MSGKYILAIDQSTSGTKALIFNEAGDIIARSDLPHDQIISEKGWVEHNPNQIYANTLSVVEAAVKKASINKNDIVGVGISNQRQKEVINNLILMCDVDVKHHANGHVEVFLKGLKKRLFTCDNTDEVIEELNTTNLEDYNYERDKRWCSTS
jgi:hypothetical protein